MRRWSLLILALAGCASRRLPLTCPTDGPTKNDFVETKTYDHYEVEGADPNTYLANARAQKPFSADVASQHGVGLTESRMCLHWQVQYDSTTCRVAAVRLHHLVRITLPKWDRPNDARAAYVEWDKGASAKLAAHEEGHYLIATAEARALYEKALTITAAATCDEIDAQFDALLKTADRELRRKQADFDDATQHGTVDPAR